MTSTSPDPSQAPGTRLQSAYDRLGVHNVDSLATLSDGVFAIAMTLLVLDLKLPATEAIHQERELQAALIALAPRFLMFITSFLTLGIFWIAQRTQLGYLSHGDRHFAWAQIG